MFEMFQRSFDYYTDRMENGKFDEIDLIKFKKDLKDIKSITAKFCDLCADYEDFLSMKLKNFKKRLTN